MVGRWCECSLSVNYSLLFFFSFFFFFALFCYLPGLYNSAGISFAASVTATGLTV